MAAKPVEQEKTKNPAYDAATGEWVLDREHADPVFTPRRRDAREPQPPRAGSERRRVKRAAATG